MSTPRTDLFDLYAIRTPPFETADEDTPHLMWLEEATEWVANFEAALGSGEFDDMAPNELFVTNELSILHREIEELKARQARLMAFAREATSISDRKIAEVAGVSHPTVARQSKMVDTEDLRALIASIQPDILAHLTENAAPQDERIVSGMFPIPGTPYCFGITTVFAGFGGPEARVYKIEADGSLGDKPEAYVCLLYSRTPEGNIIPDAVDVDASSSVRAEERLAIEAALAPVLLMLERILRASTSAGRKTLYAAIAETKNKLPLVFEDKHRIVSLSNIKRGFVLEESFSTVNGLPGKEDLEDHQLLSFEPAKPPVGPVSLSTAAESAKRTALLNPESGVFPIPGTRYGYAIQSNGSGYEAMIFVLNSYNRFGSDPIGRTTTKHESDSHGIAQLTGSITWLDEAYLGDQDVVNEALSATIVLLNRMTTQDAGDRSNRMLLKLLATTI